MGPHCCHLCEEQQYHITLAKDTLSQTTIFMLYITALDLCIQHIDILYTMSCNLLWLLEETKLYSGQFII
jgi:hypothetical protein